MAIYKCKICGYTFDEDNIEEGLNIPAGTKFEELPASFKCPKCRMAKAMFEKIDQFYILQTYYIIISNKLRRLLIMAKFKCKLCGYTTEEFEELPEDFKCPMCGATADMFEKVEQVITWLMFVKSADSSQKKMNCQKITYALFVVYLQQISKNNKFFILNFF